MPGRRTVTVMSEPAPHSFAPLYRVLAWFSPAFPVGAFSYSHGLEAAIERGLVKDRASLQTWIAGILEFGAGCSDALLFLAAHAAVTDKALAVVIELGDA